MLGLAFYFLKVIICSGILLCYYWLMLRNKIFHQYNRFYLLAAVMLSLGLPLLQIDIWHNNDQVAPQAIQLIQAVSSSSEYLDEIIVTTQQNDISTTQLLFLFYCLISFIMLSFLIQALVKIRVLFVKHRHSLVQNIFLINTTAKGTPFSFMRYIFWNDHIDPESVTGNQVFRHELAHVQQRHSYDKLFMNVVLVVFWSNPFFWIIRKELEMIHEFVADKIAVEDSDTEAFAAMILQAAYPQHRFELTNPFFYSPIKRRLMMLTKNRNPKVGYIGRLMVLPLTIFVFAAFTLKTKTLKSNDIGYDGRTLTVVIDAGHGGTDAGGSNTKGAIFEKDLNLAISKKIKSLNTNSKIKIILTRETDIYQSPMEKVAFSKAAGADLFVSIHTDAKKSTNNEQQSGLNIFLAKNNKSHIGSSQVLASALINELNGEYPLPVAQQPRQQQASIRVLEDADCPAILIEAGNIHNDKDISYLSTTAAQENLAEKILAAIQKYAVAKEKGIANINKPLVTSTQTVSNELKDTLPDIHSKQAAKPLLILDGKIISDVSFSKILPENIESINLLKDKDGIAQFGEKGKFGVLIITTKKMNKVVLNNVNFTVENDSAKLQEIKLSNVEISYNRLFNEQQPLYVLNEKVLNKTININKIPANEIQSINVIKGKKAIDKYGLQASNGAVEINTRNGMTLQEVNATQSNYNTNTDEVVVMGYATKLDHQIKPDDKVFTLAENAPSFPGGDSAWKQYLMTNLKADMPVQEGWKAGVYRIIVSFIVRKDGSVADIRTSDYADSRTAEHCIELIRKGPKWSPATQHGHAVNAYKKQPITFVVSDKQSL